MGWEGGVGGGKHCLTESALSCLLSGTRRCALANLPA